MVESLNTHIGEGNKEVDKSVCMALLDTKDYNPTTRSRFGSSTRLKIVSFHPFSLAKLGWTPYGVDPRGTAPMRLRSFDEGKTQRWLKAPFFGPSVGPKGKKQPLCVGERMRLANERIQSSVNLASVFPSPRYVRILIKLGALCDMVI